MQEKWDFVPRNLVNWKKSSIFAADFRREVMAGKRITMSIAFKKYVGELDDQFYLRTLVKTKSDVMAVCKKPSLTKHQRKKMAERPFIQRSNAVLKEAQRIYHDPVLRAEWEKKHEVFMRAAKKRGDYTYPRLWDYIRHELNLAHQAAEK